jgi:hypothetical protein
VAPHVNDTTLRTGKSTTPRDSGLPLELERFTEFMHQRRNALREAISKALGSH